MPTHRPVRPQTRQQVSAAPDTTDPSGRAVAEVVDAVRRLESRFRDRSSLVANLAIGVNSIAHKLGRKPIGANVSPTDADATFAWAMTSADDKVAVIEVLNVAQPGAGVEFY